MQEVASGELVVSALKLFARHPFLRSWTFCKGLVWGMYPSGNLQSNSPWWLPDVEPHSVSALYRTRLGFK